MTAAVPFYRPSVGSAEVDGVAETLRSGWLANGERTALFEQRMADLVGGSAAVATASGTAGLFVALQALGVGPGDEVITTPVTCIASVNALAMTGASPVLVDVRADTLTLDPELVEAAVTDRTVAIMPVHYAGVAEDIDAIAAVARRHGLAVLDDAAHALGASSRGRPVGSTADLTVFSFSATKIITTGEGGMIVGRPDLVARARILANLGADRHATPPTAAAPSSWANVVVPGLKLAMCDVAASIGLAQLDRLPSFLARRRAIAARYGERLAGLPGLQLPVVPDGTTASWHLYTLRVTPDELGVDRDEFVWRLCQAGVTAAKQFKPAHHEPYLRERFPDLAARLPVTERESRRNLSLPMYPALTEGDVETVVSTVPRVVEWCRTPCQGVPG
ncbi:DegT/DnrJ/EryC1/StrS family aminotransferase [Micromonospora sp. NPDC005652]|uniref:DegT/DnrJ/EryC1/StrS family aminotransferase n=1 Tax=Micromonospora sp. NPDC005652 TaxID=3157046 RepID=UPI0033F8D10C